MCAHERRCDMSKLVITILCIAAEIAAVAAGFVIFLIYT